MSTRDSRFTGRGVAAAVLAGALSALATGPAQAFPTRAFYPLDPGNWWAYREYLNEDPHGHGVTFVERGTVLAPDATVGQPVVTAGSYTTTLGVGGTFSITVTPEAFEEVMADTSCNGSFAPSITPPSAWALRVRLEGAFVGGPAEETFTEQEYYVSGVGPVASVESEEQGVWLERICAAGVAGQRAVRADFDNDDRSDPAYFRASDGTWHVLLSATGTALEGAWGQNGDVSQAAGDTPLIRT